MLTWLGLLGTWLLVGGPVFQAILELREYNLVREQIAASVGGVPLPPRVSPWWWLLPPVYYHLSRRRAERYFRTVLASLTPAAARSVIALFDKTTGWFLVAGGAILLATRETLTAAATVGIGRPAGFATSALLVTACCWMPKLRVARSQTLASERESGSAPRLTTLSASTDRSLRVAMDEVSGTPTRVRDPSGPSR
jgi:hypothetical protein